MIAYGTRWSAVTPGKGGQTHLDRPVFDTVKEASKQPQPRPASRSFHRRTPATRLMEAADAGLRLVCIITDGIPRRT